MYFPGKRGLYRFQNKVVWLTGASRGIGYELAKRLFQLGAHIAVTARDKKLLEERFSHFTDCLIVPADISKRQQNIDVVNDIVNHFGQLDCVTAVCQ